MGPGAWCIAGPEIFASAAEIRRRVTNFEISASLRNLSGLDQRNFEIRRRLAFAPQSRNAFGLSAAHIMACLAMFDHVRTVTSRLAGSIIRARWRHWLLFPSGFPADLWSASAARRLDHMIRGDDLRSPGARLKDFGR